jgi:hypothetical protein
VDTSQGSGSSRNVSHLERDIAKFGLVIWQMVSLDESFIIIIIIIIM